MRALILSLWSVSNATCAGLLVFVYMDQDFGSIDKQSCANCSAVQYEPLSVAESIIVPEDACPDMEFPETCPDGSAHAFRSRTLWDSHRASDLSAGGPLFLAVCLSLAVLAFWKHDFIHGHPTRISVAALLLAIWATADGVLALSFILGRAQDILSFGPMAPAEIFTIAAWVRVSKVMMVSCFTCCLCTFLVVQLAVGRDGGHDESDTADASDTPSR